MAKPELYSPILSQRQIPGVTVTLVRQTRQALLPHHGHEQAYFSFLMSGSYRERIGSLELDQQAPCVVFHPPGMEHRDAYGPSGGQLLSINFDYSWAESWVGSQFDRTDPGEIGGERVLRAAWGLYNVVRQQESYAALNALEIEDHVGELLNARIMPDLVANRVPPRWLNRVVERLREEYAEPPGMSRLAQDCGVHPAHLSRTFRRYQGCSPTSFIQQLRVQHVWNRLVEDAQSTLAEIATDAGFCDQSHCTRVFRRLVGVPPGTIARHTSGRINA